MNFEIEQGLDFDDVLIKPIPSLLNSRNDVDISVKLSDALSLSFPVIASPMRGIVDAYFASCLSELGGVAILPRFFNTLEEWKGEIDKISVAKNFGLSMGLKDNFEWLLERAPDILCVDVANGYTKNLLNICRNIKNYIVKNNLKTLLMSGNVATFDGFKNLESAGVDLIRVGIGPGALCSTRNVTGIGIPQITAISECSRTNNSIIVADGGIKNSGDAVKAFVAGADVIMAGSLFGQTYESPNDGTIYGMASKRLQEEMDFTQIKSIEGIEKAMAKTMSLEKFVNDFSWGIRSAGTYLNAKNISEIKNKGEFILSGKNSIKDL